MKPTPPSKKTVWIGYLDHPDRDIREILIPWVPTNEFILGENIYRVRPDCFSKKVRITVEEIK
jgi:hypothetical protein